MVFIVLALCLHKYIVKVIDFIISIPFYRRALPIAIAGLSTLATAGLSKSSSILISIICYVLTFAYNEYIVKKEVQSTKEPLEKELSNRDELIAKYRTLLEEKKNKFQRLIIRKLDQCHRIGGDSDEEILHKIKKELGDLQDAVLAEETFLETPDEALRRIENSTSGNEDLAMKTMLGE